MSVVVITGCSSGFGLEGALAFARNGDQVYATMRDPDRAGDLLEAATRENLDVEVRKLESIGRINALFTQVQQPMTAVASPGNCVIPPRIRPLWR